MGEQPSDWKHPGGESYVDVFPHVFINNYIWYRPDGKVLPFTSDPPTPGEKSLHYSMGLTLCQQSVRALIQAFSTPYSQVCQQELNLRRRGPGINSRSDGKHPSDRATWRTLTAAQRDLRWCKGPGEKLNQGHRK